MIVGAILCVIISFCLYLWMKTHNPNDPLSITEEKCLDRTLMYQRVYANEVASYSDLMKRHLVHMRFLELFELCYPDKIITLSRIRNVLLYVIYGITDIKTIPNDDICIPIQKTLHKFTKYYSNIYIPFDDMIHFVETMDVILTDKMKLFDSKIGKINNSMTLYNKISQYAINKCENAESYMKLYDTLCQNSFECVDMNNGNDDTIRLRLFVRIPTYHCDNRIKVYVPIDSNELEDIIESFETNRIFNCPIIIAQIVKIFPTHNYDGIAIGSDTESMAGSIVKSIAKSIAQNAMSTNSNFKINTITSEESPSPYEDVIQTLMLIFDFIKDLDSKVNIIDVQLKRGMTIFAPKLSTSYEKITMNETNAINAMKPILKFKLIDPMCYPYSFHKIYKFVRDNLECVTNIRKNPYMMKVEI